MNEVAHASSELLRQLLLLLSVGLPGMPPGASDPQLVSAIPADAVFAMQWSGRSAGTPGAEGLAGALADPEIARAAAAIRVLAQFTSRLERELPAGDETKADTDWTAIAETWLRHPGCLYVTVGLPSQAGLSGLTSMIRAGVILSPGEDIDEVLEELSTRLPAWALVDAHDPNAPQPATTGLVKHYRFGQRLAWSFSDNLAGVPERLTSGTGGLGGTPHFQRMLDQISLEPQGSWLWLQLPGHLANLATSATRLPPEVQSKLQQELLGLGTLRVLGATGLEGGRVVSRAAIECPALAGPAAMLFRPIRLENLRRVPADAHIVAALGCDLEALLAAAIDRVASMIPGDSDPADLRRRLETELGLNWKQDLAPAFGSTWVVSSSPSTGGALGLGPVFSLEVRDPRAAYAAFTQGMHWLQRALDGAGSANSHLTNELFLDRTLYTVQSGQRDAGGLAPCLCITDQELLITLQPQTMRSHLRFLERAGPTFADRVADAHWPAGAAAGVFIDAPRFTEVVWPLLPLAANAPLNCLTEFGLGIDANIWPSTAAMLQYSAPCTAAITPTELGCICEVRNPLSLAIPILAGLALPALQRADLPQSESAGAAETGVEVDLGAPAGPAGEPLPVTDPINDPAVQPAVHVETAAAKAFREMAPGLIRALTPDDLEMLIPAEVFQRLEAGPDPERLKRREERRLEREKRRTLKP